jgi:hypothetical protein
MPSQGCGSHTKHRTRCGRAWFLPWPSHPWSLVFEGHQKQVAQHDGRPPQAGKIG